MTRRIGCRCDVLIGRLLRSVASLVRIGGKTQVKIPETVGGLIRRREPHVQRGYAAHHGQGKECPSCQPTFDELSIAGRDEDESGIALFGHTRSGKTLGQYTKTSAACLAILLEGR